MSWHDLTRRLAAEYRQAHPEMVRYERRTGGAPPDNEDGDAGARAIALAVTAGHSTGKVRRDENGHPADHPPTYERVNRSLRRIADEQRDQQGSPPPPSARPKHTGWIAREREIIRRLNWKQVYLWKRGKGEQPTITQALENYGSGICPLPIARRFYGAAYIDSPTRTLYDLTDRTIRAEHRSGEVQEPAAITAEGTHLYRPEEYRAIERKVRFYFAAPR